MKKIIVFIIFFLFACANPAPNFSPGGNKLPDGTVGQAYFSEVEITNAVVFKENVGVNISPMDSGLRWKPEVITLEREGQKKEEEDYHHIIISGKPKKTGEILIHINGYTMGTSTPGRKIDKVYRIKINRAGDNIMH
ncbi:hypothetical protein [Intestinirhabdus alba]|jgi:hypothetical protein|uniref:Lipoprotein n=1 Tax=Intestinirhabdus alba TaxID=2899544 RepID=A0A6L6IRG6_9ENTR|nr:hypothetical protein [Intestinirhabdus alba]MTH47610.1 hypothetical protein [Intestinirhabdus alba]